LSLKPQNQGKKHPSRDGRQHWQVQQANGS
jgi:hypothetical protein